MVIPIYKGKTVFNTYNNTQHCYKKIYYLVLLILLGFSSQAQAHLGIGGYKGFQAGFIHPFLGLDHIVALSSIGLWTSLRDKKIRIISLLSLVLGMVIGGLIGIKGHFLPYIEEGIILSIITLGILLVFSYQLNTYITSFLISVFAFFHGHAHGTELINSLEWFSYATGFVTAAILLFSIGLIIGDSCHKNFIRFPIIRYSGILIAAIGLGLLR